MKVRITKPCRAYVLPCVIETTQTEADRLFTLGNAEVVAETETRTAKKETKKAK